MFIIQITLFNEFWNHIYAYLLLNKIEHLNNWLRNENIPLYLSFFTSSIQLLMNHYYTMKILIYVQDLIFIVLSYYKKSVKLHLKQIYIPKNNTNKLSFL